MCPICFIGAAGLSRLESGVGQFTVACPGGLLQGFVLSGCGVGHANFKIPPRVQHAATAQQVVDNGPVDVLRP